MADLLKPARTRIVEKALPKETESALPKVTPGGTGMTKEDQRLFEELLAPSEWQKEQADSDAQMQKMRSDVMGSGIGIAPEKPQERYEFMSRLGNEHRRMDFSGGINQLPQMSEELRYYLLRKFFEQEDARDREAEESMSDIDRRIREMKNFYGGDR